MKLGDSILNLRNYLSYLWRDKTHPLWPVVLSLSSFALWIIFLTSEGILPLLFSSLRNPMPSPGPEYILALIIFLFIEGILLFLIVFFIVRLFQIFEILRRAKIIKWGKRRTRGKRIIEREYIKKMKLLYLRSLKRNRPRKFLTAFFNAFSIVYLGKILFGLMEGLLIYAPLGFFPAHFISSILLPNFPMLVFTVALGVVFVLPLAPVVEKITWRFVREHISFDTSEERIASKKANRVLANIFLKCVTGVVIIELLRGIKKLRKIKFPKDRVRKSCAICPHLKFCVLAGDEESFVPPCRKIHPLRLLFTFPPHPSGRHE